MRTKNTIVKTNNASSWVSPRIALKGKLMAACDYVKIFQLLY